MSAEARSAPRRTNESRSVHCREYLGCDREFVKAETLGASAARNPQQPMRLVAARGAPTGRTSADGRVRRAKLVERSEQSSRLCRLAQHAGGPAVRSVASARSGPVCQSRSRRLRQAARRAVREASMLRHADLAKSMRAGAAARTRQSDALVDLEVAQMKAQRGPGRSV